MPVSSARNLPEACRRGARRRSLAARAEELNRLFPRFTAFLRNSGANGTSLASDLDPEALRPKRIYQRNRYFARNELSRLCLDVFRTARGEPISIDAIAEQVIAAKGFDPADGILRAAIHDQVGDVVKRLHRRETVEKIGRGPWRVKTPAHSVL